MSTFSPVVTPGPGRLIQDYLALTKPRIVLLILITAVTAMWVASSTTPSAVLVLYTLLGTGLAAGSANAFNCYLDRDVDGMMLRTRTRPLPAGRLSPGQALTFGFALGSASMAILGGLVNLLAAAIALSGILFYVFVYTMWLKRSTPQNIVIGGAAGSVPPLIAWAAVTNSVELPAVIMFAIIFLWTPPHFWALALFRNDDYRRANIPMMPVVRGDAETHRQILLYTIVLVLTSLALYPLGSVGMAYLIAALLLGGVFISMAWKTMREASHKAASHLFGYSIAYLALLFLAMVLDRQGG